MRRCMLAFSVWCDCCQALHQPLCLLGIADVASSCHTVCTFLLSQQTMDIWMGVVARCSGHCDCSARDHDSLNFYERVGLVHNFLRSPVSS